MTSQEWGILIGGVMSAVLALGPWMFMVHAKLAVIASRIVDLGEKMEKAAEANRELWKLYAQHEARLDTHDVQFSHISQRLQELS
ncbi:MAG: hypothetical protein ABSG68_05470 [Thermoguttaceae bacterium]|jgi:hypothetical protein